MNIEEIQYLIDNAEYEPQPLVDYINALQERIAYLERSNNRREDTILEQRQELADIDRLNNIIDELEKFIQSEIDHNVDGIKSFGGYQCKIILDKLNELKSGRQ